MYKDPKVQVSSIQNYKKSTMASFNSNIVMEISHSNYKSNSIYLSLLDWLTKVKVWLISNST